MLGSCADRENVYIKCYGGLKEDNGGDRVEKTRKQKLIEWWDVFALHTWLITSSFGIMFAVLSFLDEMSVLDGLKEGQCPKSPFCNRESAREH